MFWLIYFQLNYSTFFPLDSLLTYICIVQNVTKRIHLNGWIVLRGILIGPNNELDYGELNALRKYSVQLRINNENGFICNSLVYRFTFILERSTICRLLMEYDFRIKTAEIFDVCCDPFLVFWFKFLGIIKSVSVFFKPFKVSFLTTSWALFSDYCLEHSYTNVLLVHSFVVWKLWNHSILFIAKGM